MTNASTWKPGVPIWKTNIKTEEDDNDDDDDDDDNDDDDDHEDGIDDVPVSEKGFKEDSFFPPI